MALYFPLHTTDFSSANPGKQNGNEGSKKDSKGIDGEMNGKRWGFHGVHFLPLLLSRHTLEEKNTGKNPYFPYLLPQFRF